MSNSVLDRAQLGELLSGTGPSCHTADLIWVLGETDAALALYEQAAAAGDLGALLSLAVEEQVRPEPAPISALVERAQRAVSIGGSDLGDTLGVMMGLAALRLHDVDSAVEIGLLAVRFTDQWPIPFSSVGPRHREALETAIDAALTRAIATVDPTRRASTILLAGALGAEQGRRGPKWHRRLLTTAQQGAEGILLLAVLNVLDGAANDYTADDETTKLLEYLSKSIKDDEERLTYRLRRLDALAARGEGEMLLNELSTLNDSLETPCRATVLERCQRAALAVSRHALAAEMARARAQKTSDNELTFALLLQAEQFVRLSRSGGPALATTARELVDWCRRSSSPHRSVFQHGLRVLEAATIQKRSWANLRNLWDDPAFADHIGPRRVERMLLREESDPVQPQPADVGRLVRQIGKGLSVSAERCLRTMILCSQGWSELVGLASSAAEAAPDTANSDRQTTRLQAFTSLFRRNDPDTAISLLLSLEDDVHPATAVGLWEASRRLDRLAAWEANQRPADGSEPHTVLMAATRAESGDLTGARSGLAALPTSSPLRSHISNVLDDLESQSSQDDRSGFAALPEPDLKNSEAAATIALAEDAFKDGHFDTAAEIFERTARSLGQGSPMLASNLLLRADASLPERDPTTRESLLRESLGFDSSNQHAIFGLFRLLSEQDRHVEAAELVGDQNSFGREPVVPVDALRRTGRALAATHPAGAEVVFRVLVRSMTQRLEDRRLGDDIDHLVLAAKRNQHLSAARDILEEQVVAAVSDGQRGELNLKLGEFFSNELRDIDLAVEHLRRALNFPSTRSRAGRSLRTLLEQQGRWEELVEVLLTLAEAGEPSERVQVLMATADVLWDKLDRSGAAAEALEMLLAIQPKHRRALLRLADFHTANEDWDKVVKYLETAARLVEEKRARSEIYQKIGEICQMHLERPSLALENYLVSFICFSANRETFDRLDRLYSATGRYKDLAGLMDIAIETTRKQPEESPFELEKLYSRRARIEFQHLEAPQQAAESLLEALRINPGNARYIKLLETHLLEDAEPDTLLEAYRLHAGCLAPDASEQIPLLRAQAELCERSPERRTEAMELYAQLVELEPADRAAAKRLSSFYKEEKKWVELIDLYRQQLKWVAKPEETVSFTHKIARVYESELRDLPSAIETYETLLKLVPGSLSALRSLGRLYEATRMWDHLIRVSKTEVKLVEEDRVKAHLQFKIGSIYETHRNDEQRAISYYERAVDLDPRCVPALHGLRDLYARRSDTARVIEYLEREALIWDSSRERASIHTRIAEVYWTELRDAEEAITHLRKALDLVPDSGAALQRMLDIFFQQQRWSEAAPIAYSLSQHPESMRADRRGELFFRRGIIARELGNRREAVDSLKIALDIAPESAKAFELLAEILDQEGDADNHGEFFARLQKDLSERGDGAGLARVKRFLGKQAEANLDLSGALNLLQEAIELDSSSLSALRDRVRVLIRRRDFDAAFGYCESFANSTDKPDLAQFAQVIAAQILMDHLGRRADARELLHAVVAANPRHPEALFQGAQAAYLDKDWAEARRYMDELVDADIEAGSLVSRQNRCEHVFYLGRVLEVGFEDHEEALSCYALAREAYPPDPRPLKAAAGLLFKEKNWNRLDRLMDRALKGAEAHGGPAAIIPSLVFAARLSVARAQPDRAEGYLKQLLEIDSSNTVARTMLVDLVGQTSPGGDRAAAEMTALLMSNVFDKAALKGLSELYAIREDLVRSACYERVLLLSGQADPTASRTIPDVLQNPLQVQLRTEHLSEFVAPEPNRDGYLTALGILGPHLDQLQLATTTSLSVSRHSEDGEAAADGLLRQVMRLVSIDGGKIVCLPEGPRGTAVSVSVDRGPIVFLEMNCDPHSLLERREALFLLGHAAGLINRGTYSVVATPRSDLTAVLWWLSRWAQSGETAPPKTEAPWLDKCPPSLTSKLAGLVLEHRSSFPALTDPQHAQRHAIDLERAATSEGDRIGLLVSNELEACVDAILKLETGADLSLITDRVTELARSSRIANLVAYALSDEYMSLLSLLRSEGKVERK